MIYEEVDNNDNIGSVSFSVSRVVAPSLQL